MRISRHILAQSDPWHPNLPSCLTTWTCIREKFDTRSVSLPVSHSLRLFLFLSFLLVWQLSLPLLILGACGFLWNIPLLKSSLLFYFSPSLLPALPLVNLVTDSLSSSVCHSATLALGVFYLCCWAQWDSNGSAQSDWTPETRADQIDELSVKSFNQLYVWL